MREENLILKMRQLEVSTAKSEVDDESEEEEREFEGTFLTSYISGSPKKD